jgi:hypothetical protein
MHATTTNDIRRPSQIWRPLVMAAGRRRHDGLVNDRYYLTYRREGHALYWNLFVLFSLDREHCLLVMKPASTRPCARSDVQHADGQRRESPHRPHNKRSNTLKVHKHFVPPFRHSADPPCPTRVYKGNHLPPYGTATLTYRISLLTCNAACTNNL